MAYAAVMLTAASKVVAGRCSRVASHPRRSTPTCQDAGADSTAWCNSGRGPGPPLPPSLESRHTCRAPPMGPFSAPPRLGTRTPTRGPARIGRPAVAHRYRAEAASTALPQPPSRPWPALPPRSAWSPASVSWRGRAGNLGSCPGTAPRLRTRSERGPPPRANWVLARGSGIPVRRLTARPVPTGAAAAIYSHCRTC